jgi:hypothetical protein
MNTLAPGSETGIPVADCGRCRREVLTHVHLDGRGEPHRLCYHCDAEIDPGAVRWVGEDALEPLGYGLHRDEPGGCGRPGCGRGNCSSRR